MASPITEVFDAEFRKVFQVPTSCVVHLPPARLNITRLVLCRNYRAGERDSCAMGANCKFVHADCDYAQLPTHSIHVNYLWRREESCIYPRLENGVMMNVYAPRHPGESAARALTSETTNVDAADGAVNGQHVEHAQTEDAEPVDVVVASERVLYTAGARAYMEAHQLTDAATRRQSAVAPQRTVDEKTPADKVRHCPEFCWQRLCKRGEECPYAHVIHIDPDAKEGHFKRAPARPRPASIHTIGAVATPKRVSATASETCGRAESGSKPSATAGHGDNDRRRSSPPPPSSHSGTRTRAQPSQACPTRGLSASTPASPPPVSATPYLDSPGHAAEAAAAGGMPRRASPRCARSSSLPSTPRRAESGESACYASSPAGPELTFRARRLVTSQQNSSSNAYLSVTPNTFYLGSVYDGNASVSVGANQGRTPPIVYLNVAPGGLNTKHSPPTLSCSRRETASTTAKACAPSASSTSSRMLLGASALGDEGVSVTVLRIDESVSQPPPNAVTGSRDPSRMFHEALLAGKLSAVLDSSESMVATGHSFQNLSTSNLSASRSVYRHNPYNHAKLLTVLSNP